LRTIYRECFPELIEEIKNEDKKQWIKNQEQYSKNSIDITKYR
jgi:hypothetical protein